MSRFYKNHGNRKTNDINTFDDLISYRYDDGGADFTLTLILYTAGLKLSQADIDTVLPISRPLYTAAALVNDLCSFEREVLFDLDSSGQLANAVWYLMRSRGITVSEAKERLVKENIMPLEQEFLEKRRVFLARNDKVPHDLRRFLELIEIGHSGNWFWSATCPRYNDWRPNLASLELEDIKATDIDIPNATCETFLQRARPSPESGPGEPDQNKEQISTGFDDSIVLGPVQYLRSIPSKNVRATVLKALNVWLKAPEDSLSRIDNIITYFHDASLLLDDIEDNSTLRRGIPVTHEVFGKSQTINTATYLYVQAFNEYLQLHNAAANKDFIDELRNLHIGQGSDPYWSHSKRCPTVDEYLEMIRQKTAGLFCLTGHLLLAEGDGSKNVDKDSITKMMSLIGQYFQIRDDYINIASAKYHTEKGFAEDLDEGKYTLPVIHLLQHTSQPRILESLLSERSRRGSMPLHQKKLVLAEMDKSGSLKYTEEFLGRYEAEVYRLLENIEGKTGEKNFILRFLLDRLNLKNS